MLESDGLGVTGVSFSSCKFEFEGWARRPMGFGGGAGPGLLGDMGGLDIMA
jgi:hypothetical protein